MWCLAAGSAAEPAASLSAPGRRRLPRARPARPPCLAGLATVSAASPLLVSTRLCCEAARACLAEAAALWGQCMHASTKSRQAAALRSARSETLVLKLLLIKSSEHLVTLHWRDVMRTRCSKLSLEARYTLRWLCGHQASARCSVHAGRIGQGLARFVLLHTRLIMLAKSLTQ